MPLIDWFPSVGVGSPNLSIPGTFGFDAVLFYQRTEVSFSHGGSNLALATDDDVYVADLELAGSRAAETTAHRNRGVASVKGRATANASAEGVRVALVITSVTNRSTTTTGGIINVLLRTVGRPLTPSSSSREGVAVRCELTD